MPAKSRKKVIDILNIIIKCLTAIRGFVDLFNA